MCPSKADRVNCLIRLISLHWIENLDRAVLSAAFLCSHWPKSFYYLFPSLTVGIEGKHHFIDFQFCWWIFGFEDKIFFSTIYPLPNSLLYYITLWKAARVFVRMGEVSPDGLGTFILKGYLGNAHVDGLFFIKGLPLMKKISLSFSKNSKIVWHFPKFLPEQCFCYYF